MSACARVSPSPRHERHRPERTVLHAIVRAHLAGFLRFADERGDAGKPVVWCQTTRKNHDRQDTLASQAFWNFYASLIP